MDCLVRLFHGGIVRDNGEFENMKEHVEMFESPPTYMALVHSAWRLLRCGFGAGELRLRGRFDCGKARAHYVLMTISSESEWNRYKDIVKESNVKCFEVVLDLQTKSDFIRLKQEALDGQLNLEEDARDVKRQMVRDGHTLQEGHDQLGSGSFEDSRDAGSFKQFEVSDNFDRAVVSDRFDANSLAAEEEEEDDDDISLGSDEEDDDEGSSEGEGEQSGGEEEQDGPDEEDEGGDEDEEGGGDDEEGDEQESGGEKEGSESRRGGAVEVLYNDHSDSGRGRESGV
jgi:hypothetical protein